MMNQEERRWINEHFAKVQEQLTLLRIDVARLKIKSGIWGLMGGLIPVLVTIGIYLVYKRI